MTAMQSADWRSYRGHLIIARKTLLGWRRYDVWTGSGLVRTCRDEVAAELHIDAVLRDTA